MNGLGNQLLAGAGRTCDHDGCLGLGDLADHFVNLEHGLALADDVSIFKAI